MATYALIHGSGDSAYYWHLVEPELRNRGHDVIAPDLPIENESAGLTAYADTVIEAIGDRRDLIVVAQSGGGFTAPLVADRLPTDLIVLIAGMVPLPGERADDWFGNTGYGAAAAESGVDFADEIEVFYNDLPRQQAEEALRHGRSQSDRPGQEPFPLDSWPDIPTRYLLCTEDHFFPAEWMRGVIRDRLGIEPDEIVSGHCPALSRPKQLAGRLEAYRVELAEP